MRHPVDIIVNNHCCKWQKRESNLAKLALTQIGNDGLQISLMSGQSCTIGSSAAADYSLTSEELDEIHCRITCRGNSCFVECFHFESKIIVNDKNANRSSLSDGDSLRLGKHHFLVDFESNRVRPVELVESTNEQEYDSLEEVFSLPDAAPIDADDDSKSPSSLAPESSADELDADVKPVAQESLEENSLFQDSLDDDSHASDSDSLDHDSDEPFGFDDQGFDFPEVSDEQPTVADTSEQGEKDSDLEFASDQSEDSIQPDSNDTSLDSEDFSDSVTPSEMPEHSTTVIGTELSSDFEDAIDSEADSTLADLRDMKSWKLDEDSDEPIAPSGDPKASEFLRNLANRSLLDKKSGDEAVVALMQILDSNDANLFQIQSHAIKLIEFSEFEEFTDVKDSVFLVSELAENELQTLLVEKRWLGRMKYPLGLQRYLELSPSKIFDSFFKAVSACVFKNAKTNQCELIVSANKVD